MATATASPPDLLDTEQAAEFLGIARGTLEVWRCTRRYGIPFIRVGRRIRYRREVLERWLERRTVQPGNDD